MSTRQERRRAERAAKKEEKFQMHFDLLQPWSTFAMKTQLPPLILEKMLKTPSFKTI